MKKNLKQILFVGLLVIALGAILFTNNTLQAEDKNKVELAIGYVDIAAVFVAHPETAAAKTELDARAAEMQQQLETELKGKTEEEMEEIRQEYQSQLITREQELYAQITSSIDQVLREVAAELEIKIVLDKRNVIYGGEDLTDAVKKRIDEKYSND